MIDRLSRSAGVIAASLPPLFLFLVIWYDASINRGWWAPW